MKPFNVFPYDSNIHFMRLRWISLTVAGLLMFVALGAMFTKGFNFALDFTGGVGIELPFHKAPDVDDVRNRLEKAGYSNPSVQTFGTGTDLLVRLQDKQRADQPAGRQGARAEWRLCVAVRGVRLPDLHLVPVRVEVRHRGDHRDLARRGGGGRLVRADRARVRPHGARGRAVGDGLLDQRHDRGVRPRARELPFCARGAGGDPQSFGQPDLVAYGHHLVRGVPHGAGVVHLRWWFVAGHGGVADARHHHRYVVVDLRGVPVADVAGRDEAGPDAEGEGRSCARASAVIPADVGYEEGRAMRGLFLWVVALFRSRVYFAVCATTSPAVICGGFGSNGAMFWCTQSAACLLDASTPARSWKTLVETITPPPASAQ